MIATWWEATDAERADILALVDEVKDRLDAELQPDGYNVGFNAGAAAGQTVGHLHIHVIPRYHGDVPDPRGGVRHVIPGKGNYLLPAAEPYALIDGQDRLLRDDLLRCLRDPRFDRVDLLVSFVMKSGLEQVHGGLVDALDRGATLSVLTTDYLTVTDAGRPGPVARPGRDAAGGDRHPGVPRSGDELPSQGLPVLVRGRRGRDGVRGQQQPQRLGYRWRHRVGRRRRPGRAPAGRLRAAVVRPAQPTAHPRRCWRTTARRWRPATHTAGVVPEPPATPPAPRPVQREALDGAWNRPGWTASAAAWS